MCVYVCMYVRLYSPLLDLGRFFSFLILYTVGRDSLDGGSARRKAATCTQIKTNTEWSHTDIDALSGIRTTIPAFERAKTAYALDPAATVIGFLGDWEYNIMIDLGKKTVHENTNLGSNRNVLRRWRWTFGFHESLSSCMNCLTKALYPLVI
jgi:hypothetical protein